VSKLVRLILILSLALLPTLTLAQAQGGDVTPIAPVKTHKAWYKDWKVILGLGISIGASGAATYEAHECRLRVGVAPCDGGYGEFKAREIVRFAGTVGEDAIALGMRHQGFAFKYWAPVMFGFPAYNTSVAIRQPLISCPTGEKFLYGTKYTCIPDSTKPTW
jgi:hypothetical protein